MISHIRTPNAQTSDWDVNTPSTKDSGAIQLDEKDLTSGKVVFKFLKKSLGFVLITEQEATLPLLFDSNHFCKCPGPVRNLRF